jgi:hypothetical protein
MSLRLGSDSRKLLHHFLATWGHNVSCLRNGNGDCILISRKLFSSVPLCLRRHGGAGLFSRHLAGWGKRIASSRPACATQGDLVPKQRQKQTNKQANKYKKRSLMKNKEWGLGISILVVVWACNNRQLYNYNSISLWFFFLW